MLTVVRTSVSCPRTAVGSAATGGFVGSAPDCVPCVDNKPSTAEHIVEVALCVFVPCVSVCVCVSCLCVCVGVCACACCRHIVHCVGHQSCSSASSCTYTCEPGYFSPSAAVTLTCAKLGGWPFVPLSCSECVAPAAPANGWSSCPSLAECHYGCDSGYVCASP